MISVRAAAPPLPFDATSCALLLGYIRTIYLTRVGVLGIPICNALPGAMVRRTARVMDDTGDSGMLACMASRLAKTMAVSI
jgi:hypothetical protein